MSAYAEYNQGLITWEELVAFETGAPMPHDDVDPEWLASFKKVLEAQMEETKISVVMPHHAGTWRTIPMDDLQKMQAQKTQEEPI